MKAATYRETGAAGDVLRVEEVDRPDPGPGQVRVRMQVSAVNPTDVKARSGAVPRPIDEFQVPHQDGAGTIDAVGAGVDEGRIGQRVWLWMAASDRWGTAAEWTVVPDEQAVRLPDRVSFEMGAQLGVPAMTAHRCLFADGSIDGLDVLVQGGAGAVGHFAIELAVRAGARVVSTVSGPEKAALARAAGARDVVDYRSDHALEQLKAFAPKMGRIIEVNVGANLGRDLELSGPETVIVCYAATGADPTLPVRAGMSANVVIRFVLLFGVPLRHLLHATHEITEALETGSLSQLPTHVFPLAEIAAAHEAQEAGVTGKVLITLG